MNWTKEIAPIVNAHLSRLLNVKGSPSFDENPISGPGGGRTHVQTRNYYVFFMLSLQLVFDMKQATDSQPHTYLEFFNLRLQDSSAAVSLWWSLIAQNQEQGRCTRLTCRDLSAEMKRNHILWLGSKCVRIVVISDCQFLIKESLWKNLCMLAQLFFLLSNPRVGPRFSTKDTPIFTFLALLITTFAPLNSFFF